VQRYGEAQGHAIQYAEAFELCQYGAQPSAAELNELFPL
jgi:N-acetylglucosamine malate deacetylase 1